MEIGRRTALSALDRREPFLVTDAGELALGPLEAGVVYSSRSFINYPITLAEKGIAVLNLTDKAGGKPFTQTDLDVLDAIVPQIAVAIDRITFKEQAGTYAQLSVTDPLTGLSNRRYLETRLTEEILRSSRHGFSMSFMMLDVDEFKSYNDRFGHPAGDDALKLVGVILKDMVRGEDVPARYGGEEFAVLFPQTSVKEAEVIAERIRERIQDTVFPYRRITVSIGLSTYSHDLGSMHDIISAADQALYDAKRLGRNKVCSFGHLGDTSENVH
jgi:diguanylate cyclase (GGDEF)-like protein